MRTGGRPSPTKPPPPPVGGGEGGKKEDGGKKENLSKMSGERYIFLIFLVSTQEPGKKSSNTLPISGGEKKRGQGSARPYKTV